MRKRYFFIILFLAIFVFLSSCVNSSQDSGLNYTSPKITITGAESGDSYVYLEWGINGNVPDNSKIKVLRSDEGTEWTVLEILDISSTNTIDLNVIPGTKYIYEVQLLNIDNTVISKDEIVLYTKEVLPPSYETKNVTGKIELPSTLSNEEIIIHNIESEAIVNENGEFNISVKADSVSAIYATSPNLEIPLMNILLGNESNVIIDYETTAQSLLFLNPLLVVSNPTVANEILQVLKNSSKVFEFSQLIKTSIEGGYVSETELMEAYQSALLEVLNMLKENQVYTNSIMSKIKMSDIIPKKSGLNEYSREDKRIEKHIINLKDYFKSKENYTEITSTLSKYNIDGEWTNFTIEDKSDCYRIIPEASQNYIETTFVVMLKELDPDKIPEYMLPYILNNVPLYNYFKNDGYTEITTLEAQSFFEKVDLLGLTIDYFANKIFGEKAEYFDIPKNEYKIYALASYGGWGDLGEFDIFGQELNATGEDFYELLNNNLETWNITFPQETLNFMVYFLNFAAESVLETISIFVDVEDVLGEIIKDSFIDAFTSTIKEVLPKYINSSNFDLSQLDILHATKMVAEFETELNISYAKNLFESSSKVGTKALIKVLVENISKYFTVIPKLLDIISDVGTLGHKIATVFFVSPRELYFIVTGENQNTGEDTLKWKYLTGGTIYSSPAIGSDGTIYVGSDDGYLYAISSAGSLKWKYNANGAVFYPSPAIGSDGTIYIASDSSYLYALNPNGTLKWSYYTTSGIIDSSPAIGSDGTIYIGGYDGYLYAISSFGSLKWKYQTDGGIASSPAIGSDGTIYVGSDDGYLYAISSAGSLKWEYYAGTHIFNWLASSPAIGSDGTIYIGSENGYLYGITLSGSLKWKYSTGDSIYSSPAIGSDGTIYVGSTDGYLYAIYSSSLGLSNSSWPKFRHDIKNSGNYIY